MDKQGFVQNVKMYCQLRGVKPTIACAESGAGKSILSQMETRGTIPSVEKVQLLAQYLGVTTSELLGEAGPQNLAIQDQPYLVMRYNSLPPKVQEEVMAFIEFKAAQQSEKK